MLLLTSQPVLSFSIRISVSFFVAVGCFDEFGAVYKGRRAGGAQFHPSSASSACSYLVPSVVKLRLLLRQVAPGFSSVLDSHISIVCHEWQQRDV
jgi:hypothetical protein